VGVRRPPRARREADVFSIEELSRVSEESFRPARRGVFTPGSVISSELIGGRRGTSSLVPISFRPSRIRVTEIGLPPAPPERVPRERVPSTITTLRPTSFGDLTPRDLGEPRRPVVTRRRTNGRRKEKEPKRERGQVFDRPISPSFAASALDIRGPALDVGPIGVLPTQLRAIPIARRRTKVKKVKIKKRTTKKKKK